jgi:hypothetical protein
LNYFYTLLFLLTTSAVFSQTATVQGIIFDESRNPIAFANVSTSQGGTVSNSNGFYQLKIPAEQTLKLKISYIGFKPITAKLNLKNNQVEELNFILKTSVEQIGEVILKNDGRTRIEGITTLDPETIRKIPGANAGVENLLKTLPGVNSNNELSTQYSVRGGNFDENLVYVNDIEIYRPFLIRSGQQEGLSFVNTDLVRNVEFSAGGFKARYGDKMSSVLDIEYRRPVNFGGSFEASFLGGSASVEGVSKNKKLSAIVGMRYRDNSLFVNANETEANFKPRFADVQTFLTYQFNPKFEISFLGNIAVNSYSYEPFTRQTNFGTIDDPQALLIFYEGEEESLYETYLGAFKATYKPNDSYTGKFIASAYHTKEQEYFDILANYRLGSVSTDFGDGNLGEVEFTEGAGSQFTHARNNLDALIFNLQHLAGHQIDEHLIEYGARYSHEDIRDRLQEYEVIDSAGFSVRPPLPDFGNDQPYNPFEAPIEAFQSIRALNSTKIDRITAFLQWSYRTRLGSSKVWMNAGVRSQVWRVSGEGIESNTQQVISPRGQVSIKPDWDKDMVFRLSGGFYHQPPFYRELRDSTGTVIPDVKAQESIHIVAGNDYSFKLWDRPFKLVTEGYYKKLNNVNPYTIENVRLRYRARNDAEAYAYGLDMRLNGEFVPGTESWFSFGYLKTEERQGNREYISRPTDQRLKFAALFQDYVPNIPKLKLYLNLVYNTGLPGGSPQFEDPYDYQSRLPDYQRLDVGFFYALKEANDTFEENSWLNIFENLDVGFEIFNMFDRLNSITNTFVRDSSSRNQFAIPNFLSPRVFNLKLSANF